MNIPERCDVAIVGGGPAGSALAALLAKAGRRPVLLERDRFPRRKVCGEFLSMESQGLLDSLGCLDAVRALGPAAIDRARFYSPSGRVAEFSLGLGALGLSRQAFDETLFRHAQSSGALGFEGANVMKISAEDGETRLEIDQHLQRVSLKAKVIIDARGRPPVPAGTGPLFIGFKRHHRFKPGKAAESVLRGAVEIHLFPGGYCGINAVEGGAVNVCLLVKDRWLASRKAPNWEAVAHAMAEESPSLQRRFEALTPDGPPSAVARVCLRAPPPHPGLRIGDAAGMIAPLCGDGQAMALESALLMADFLTRDEPPERWDAVWNRRFAARLRVGRGLQRLLLNPWGAELAVGLLGLWPPGVRLILRSTRNLERNGVPKSSGH